MATYFSEVYAAQSDATTPPPTSIADPRTLVTSGKSHAKMYSKNIHMDFTAAADLAANDVIRICTFKSGDRPLWFYLTNEAAWAATALTANLGLYLTGDNHDGAVVDADLFGSAVDLTATLVTLDVLTEAGTVTVPHHGKTLWEMAALGAASYTEDPGIEFDLCLTIVTATTVTAQGVLTFNAEYAGAKN